MQKLFFYYRIYNQFNKVLIYNYYMFLMRVHSKSKRDRKSYDAVQIAL
jgi:hypothetical protein